MIHALVCGCDYKGESFELPDCELDATNVAARLKRFVGDVVLLRGKDVIKAAIIDQVHTIADRKADYEPVFAYFSGHGTTANVGGKTIQGIVLNDATVFWENELRALFQKISPAVFAVDACFCFGLARGKRKLARYVPFELLAPRPISPAAAIEVDKPRYYYAACNTNETADSTGKGGAFTNVLLPLLDRINSQTTFASLYTAIRMKLPSKQHRQTPQFYCRKKEWAAQKILAAANQWNKHPR